MRLRKSSVTVFSLWIIYLLLMLALVYPIVIIPRWSSAPNETAFYRFLASYGLLNLKFLAVYAIVVAILAALCVKGIKLLESKNGGSARGR